MEPGQEERTEGRTFLGAADPEGAEAEKFGRTPSVELDAVETVRHFRRDDEGRNGSAGDRQAIDRPSTTRPSPPCMHLGQIVDTSSRREPKTFNALA